MLWHSFWRGIDEAGSIASLLILYNYLTLNYVHSRYIMPLYSCNVLRCENTHCDEETKSHSTSEVLDRRLG